MSAQRGGSECDAPSHWTATPCDERPAGRTSDADSDESRTRQFCLRERPSDTPSVSCLIKSESQEEHQNATPDQKNRPAESPHKANASTRAHKGGHTNTGTAEAREGPPRHWPKHNRRTHTHTPRHLERQPR